MEPTVADTLQEAARRLAPVSDSPRLDAELLLGRVTGLSRAALRVHDTEALSAGNHRAFEQLVRRRAEGAPVAYLTGHREFWSLRLAVTPDVLVPRPETEMLVEQVLLLPCDAGASPALLDLGTGSGAIALAIASERPRMRITAVDVSEGALRVARQNAEALGLGRIDWRSGSWYDAVPGERFDVIVSNPPYVAGGDPALERLAAEPAIALTPGPSGLEALALIVAGAAAHLKTRGWLLLEHGNGQAGEVTQLLERHGFSRIRTLIDPADEPRVTLGTVLSPHPPSLLSSHQDFT